MVLLLLAILVLPKSKLLLPNRPVRKGLARSCWRWVVVGDEEVDEGEQAKAATSS